MKAALLIVLGAVIIILALMAFWGAPLIRAIFEGFDV